MAKIRLDDLLVEKGLAANRRESEAILLSGVVRVDGHRQDKAGTLVPRDSEVVLAGESRRYVSRGGLKLEGALKSFALDVNDLVCVDLGASTGGFTDCLLKHGARKVYAFDVGKGQLDWGLRKDPRVIVRDGFNVRYISPADVGEEADLVTADLSFISLRHIIPALVHFRNCKLLLLVKPQFEARRDEVEAGGLIRSESKRLEVLERVKAYAADQGCEILGEDVSTLPGQKGNIEYFLLLRM
jgi:23S rRNA (cytidine1920-2'-O)/16S rRNA (cytidine1409-2'-O)-methyltransferase